MRIITILIVCLVTCSSFGQTFSESDIKELAIQCENRSKGVDVGNGMLVRSCLAIGRTLIYQYDVPEGWEPYQNMKQEIISNNISAGMADTFYSRDINVEYHYFSGNSLLKRIVIRSKEFSVYGMELGEYLSIEGHPKAKSVNMKLRIPTGWDVQEGDRPNIVKKFVHGDNSYLILIKKYPVFLSKNDGSELLQDAEFVNELHAEWKTVFKDLIIDSQRFVSVDTYPALEFKLKGTMERLGVKINMTVRTWMVVYEDRMVSLAGYSVGDSDDTALQQLFFNITNSVIFPEQYN